VIPNLIAGCAFLLLPAAQQSAVLQAPPAPAKSETVAKANDVRLVQRQTTDAAAAQMQPPPGMSFIPGGQVILGSDVGKAVDGQTDTTVLQQMLSETPKHTATVGSLFIDTTEVTNLQWKVYLDATGRKPSDTLKQYGWPDGTFPAGQEYFPIANVNIPEIKDYLVWCGKRLPTEEEWTRAARGDDDRSWPWGSNWDLKLCQSGATVPTTLVPVGSFPGGASPYGVLDMAGNVAEWVDSPFSAFEGFEAYQFKQGKKTVTVTPEFNSTSRVFKGGCYVNTRMQTRIDARFSMAGASSDAGLGFRACRSLQPGLESVRHGLKRLQPPEFARTGLDDKDMFGKEVTYYDDDRKVITGYHFLAFSHRAAEKGKPLSVVRKDSVDVPLPLGVLVTSEPMILTDMRDPKTHKPVAIPAGEYTMCFKGQGESKSYKKKKATKKEDKPDEKADVEKDKPKPGKDAKSAKDAKDPKAAKPGNDKPDDNSDANSSSGDLGAAVPWPGIGSIHDIAEDIDFPQDDDVILYINAANAVVAWQKCTSLVEVDVAPIDAESADNGKSWTIEFSIDQVTGKSPRFKLPIKLGGAGLP
jgi:formylglycine-generating enzyme required for sulfatase activity